MVLSPSDGWLIPSGEAETMTVEEMEQVLLRQAWDELQAVPSYVERFSTFPVISKD